MEFFNEIVLMLVMYHMLCFSPFVPAIEIRYYIGYSCCLIVSLHLAVSLYFITAEKVRDLILKFRSYFISKLLKKEKQRNKIRKIELS